MSAVAVEGITKSFGGVRAVDAVSLAVADDEFLALLGPSGCGKTTLLRLIAGLERPDAGTVRIAGADMTAAPPYARPVNMMFQSYALFPHMTVAENVAFGLKQDGLAGAELKARVAEALALVEMEALAGRRPAQLSGGQQQRAALARCIAKRPKALLLDEPLAALDKQLRERTQLELMALRRRLGIAFIVVTHDQDEAMTMATRVAVMGEGRILQAAPPRELYARPASREVAAFFGEINLWDGVVTAAGVDCPALGLTLPNPGALAAGTRVGVALRPEQIDIGTGEVQVGGIVTEVIYRGAVSTVLLRLASGAPLRLHVSGAGTLPAPGTTLVVGWPAAAALVLP
jgi:putrescine transport system ATP-binding protein